MSRCPACGTTYESDVRFCARDGSRLLVPHAPVEPTPAGSAPSARTVTSVGAGQVLNGRYSIVRKVGEGGMSFVYLATDSVTRDRCAIKVLTAALSHDRNAMARLRREATMGMRLAHPNVCHIIDLGETDDGFIYLVMPFLDGEILADRTNRLGHLPFEDVARFLRDMADGLQVAHDLGIVHRDLKPENVMICRGADGTESAVVMDFGLAKERRAGAELQKLTATGIILGTPEFMSPEQLRGKPLDGRTDVYSLALLVYELLTGKLPFQGRTQQEMMVARLRNDPIPLRKMRPEFEYPEHLERVLLRAMHRNAEDRYATAPEFADAFASASGQRGLFGRLFGR